MKITKFDTLSNGACIQKFHLENKWGMKVVVSNLGAILTNLWIPCINNKLVDVVLGYDSLSQYRKNTNTFFGATIGRNANRISQANFSIDGKRYQLEKNEGENNLHSGPNGFQLRLWDIANINKKNNEISFKLFSPDNDQGFPGNLEALVTYCLTDDNELLIIYKGLSDRKSVFNPTNHSYFNLNGHNSGHILDHYLQINANSFTPVTSSSLLPTGEIASVIETPMDFRIKKKISDNFTQDYHQLKYTKGYDQNYVLNGANYKKAAELTGNLTNISMEVWTDMPGLQFYTGNFLDNENGKCKACYQKNAGLCLETQFYPNAINEKNFTSPIIEKNKTVCYQTTFKFK